MIRNNNNSNNDDGIKSFINIMKIMMNIITILMG